MTTATLNDVRPQGFFTAGLAQTDPEVWDAILREGERQRSKGRHAGAPHPRHRTLPPGFPA